MWLSNLFTKTKNHECDDSNKEDIVNEESINISSNQEDKPFINDLKEKVERVKEIYAKLQTLKDKQDLNLNNNYIDKAQEKNDQSTSTNEDEKNLEINNCRLEDVLRIIPIIETNLQTLTEKVSCLSGLLDEKQINAKTLIDQNIISNSSTINSAPSSVNKLNCIANKTTLLNKDTLPEIDSKENMKTHKKKSSIMIKKKETNQKVKVKINSTEIIDKNDETDQIKHEEKGINNSKLVDQLTNLDCQLESFFKSIQSALSQYKIDQVKEKSEIMDNLSRLENKININYSKMDKLMSNVDHLSKTNDHVKHVFMHNQSSIEIENRHELKKSKDDINVCIDNLIKPNPNVKQTQPSITADNPNTSRQIGGKCTINRCVCQLIDHTNAANTQIINSHNDNNQSKYGDIILCEFLKTQPTLERIKQNEYQPKVVQMNQLTNQINEQKNNHLTVCSNKSCHITNICDGNQIDDQKTSHLSVCSKNSNHLTDSCFENKIDEKKTSHLSLCSIESNHFLNSCVLNQFDDQKTSHSSLCSIESNHFLNSCVENKINNQKTNNLSVCSKNHLKNNDVTKPDEEQKINRSNLCPKPSVHQFLKTGVEFDTNSNRPISKKSVCKKNNICDFLSSQPIPEWIRLNENLIASDDLCCQYAAQSSTTNNSLNIMKFYNFERIIKDNHDCNDDIVYEITRK
ncbi:uncharacterized protein PF3D7_1120600-like [Aphis gossypii]|uniref:uncharacterized protein PF3D7_1120600-like n=1 Tax=Aphis gossypii TaxID=80765 RepID=UPI002159686C|nr:uncharacterized protein PF3D7_1120600-like [Aphis gossypii]